MLLAMGVQKGGSHARRGLGACSPGKILDFRWSEIVSL